MKKLIKIILFYGLVLIAFTGCTDTPEEEAPETRITVIGLYPVNDTESSIVITKSVEDNASYSYIDSLKFVRIDSSGSIIGANGSRFLDRPHIRDKHLMENGNIMLFGNMESENFSWYFSTRVYTPTGTLVWSRDMAERTNGVAPGLNGDLFVFGWADSDDDYDRMTFTRVDAQGDTIWNKSVQSTSLSVTVRSGVPTSDDGCLAIGYAYQRGRGGDILAVKLTSIGDTLWTGTYGGDQYDESRFAKELSDGSLLIVGELNLYDSSNANWSLNSGQQIYLIKLSANGDKLWTRAIGNTLRESPNAIMETADGSLILCGTRDESYVYLFDEPLGWVMKLTSNGEEVWLREFEKKFPMGARELANGDLLVVTQNVQEDYYYLYANNLNIMKFNTSGTLLWNTALTP